MPVKRNPHQLNLDEVSKLENNLLLQAKKEGKINLDQNNQASAQQQKEHDKAWNTLRQFEEKWANWQFFTTMGTGIIGCCLLAINPFKSIQTQIITGIVTAILLGLFEWAFDSKYGFPSKYRPKDIDLDELANVNNAAIDYWFIDLIDEVDSEHAKILSSLVNDITFATLIHKSSEVKKLIDSTDINKYQNDIDQLDEMIDINSTAAAQDDHSDPDDGFYHEIQKASSMIKMQIIEPYLEEKFFN